MATGSEEGILQTLLGSCIGLSLYDRKRRVGGLAHIVLPQSRNSGEKTGKFVDTAIPVLIGEMERLAGGTVKLAAKIAGGASMFGTKVTKNIGEENVLATERWLKEFGIPIVARDCGGEKGRRMSLDVSNGKVTIEIVGFDPLEL
ncbi:MAG: chemotaxis protein CheD [Gemmataceae bacterium]